MMCGNGCLRWPRPPRDVTNRTAVAVCAAALFVVAAISDRPLLGQPRPQVVGVPEGVAQNGRFEETQTGVIEVTYDLASGVPGASFDIALYVSDGGQPFVAATSVTGDVGPGIFPGAGKRITWQWTNDIEALAPRFDEFQFRVQAESAPVAAAVEEGGGINPLVWVAIAGGGAAGALAALSGSGDEPPPPPPPPPQCQFTVTPTSATVAAGGGTAVFTVQLAEANCTNPAWSASSPESWVTLQPSSGTGAGAVTATVDPNSVVNGSSPSRLAMLSIAGTTVSLSQAANTCNYVFSGNATDPSASGVGRGSSERTLGVNVASSCDWTGESQVPWITFESHGNASSVALSGNQTMTLRFSNNTGGYRHGGVTVAGTFFDFCQENAGGSGKIDVRNNAFCPLPFLLRP